MTAYQVMPSLTAEEYANLRDDIAANGVRVPVDVDENGQVLDGHHRALIAAELGIECPRRVLAGLSEDEKVAHAYAVNIQRRSLTREQKRALVAASLKRDPHLSDREHAKRTGVSHPTVADVRDELEQSGDVESSSTRVDAMGRQQPSTKPQPTRPADWACYCGARFKTAHTHCPTCGDHYPEPIHCPTHTVSVDTETGEVLDGPTAAGRAAADRAPLPPLRKSAAEHERERIAQQNGWLARALKHLDGIQHDDVRARLVAEWDPRVCDDNPALVNPADINAIATGLRLFAKDIRSAHVRVV